MHPGHWDNKKRLRLFKKQEINTIYYFPWLFFLPSHVCMNVCLSSDVICLSSFVFTPAHISVLFGPSDAFKAQADLGPLNPYLTLTLFSPCFYILAPPEPEDFTAVDQNETSITLQWKQVPDIHNYALVFNESEINVTSSSGIGTYTVSELQDGTRYNFKLFAVFEYARSSGAELMAVTGKMCFF